MSTPEGKRNLLFFCAKFVVFAAPLGAAWWYVLPQYAWVLMELSGGILRTLFSVPIESGSIEANGLLNTDTKLVFLIGGHALSTPVALLATNMAPYFALVLATGGIGWLRRIWILLLGAAILFAGHLLFLVLAVRFNGFVAEHPQLPTAILQFYLTLPFLLWLVLAYWDKLAAYMPDEADERPQAD